MTAFRTTPILALVFVLAGCSHFTPVGSVRPGGSGGSGGGVSAGGDDEPPALTAEDREEAIRRRRAEGPASPVDAQPEPAGSRDVWRKAVAAEAERVVVSVDHRRLWLMRGSTPVFSAPVAVGTTEPFSYRGRAYDFQTPRAVWKVLGKEETPLWVPPDWHYFELAVDRNLEPVHLKKGQKVALEDGTRIEVRGDEVGRVNQFGNFWPFTPGTEIIFEGKVFIPPIGTKQRQIPEVLGTHRLIMGDGYLIHGTNEEDSIGEAVSHGCVRMFNEDVEWLYERVAVGTPVFIY